MFYTEGVTQHVIFNSKFARDNIFSVLSIRRQNVKLVCKGISIVNSKNNPCMYLFGLLALIQRSSLED